MGIVSFNDSRCITVFCFSQSVLKNKCCIGCISSAVENWSFIELFFFSLRRNVRQHSSSVFSGEWIAEGLAVSNHRQSKNTEKRRTKPSLHRVNRFKSRVSALELVYVCNKGSHSNRVYYFRGV